VRLRTLLISIGILIGLAGYYYYFEMYRPRIEDAAKDKAREIFPLDTSDIGEFSIYGANTITLLKKDSTWWITSPIEKPADSSEIKSLLYTIAAMKIQRSLGEVGSLSDLGLDPPELSLVFKTKDAEFFLNIGNRTPTKNYRYAGSSTRDDIFLIHAYEKSSVDKDLFTLRDKHLFSASYADVRSITIKRHALILEFIKNSDGAWHLPGDKTKKAKTSKMNELLGNLCRLEAQAYSRQPDALGDPDITIELAWDDISETLEIWQMPYSEGTIYAFSAVQDCMVTLSDSLLTLIPNDFFDVMDRSLVSIDGGSVKKITVSDRTKQIFTKKADAWYRGDRRFHESHLIDSALKTLNVLEYEDRYMQIPKDVEIQRSVQIFYEDSAPVFDLVLYSQYYIGLDDQFYRINEGGMKTVNDSLDMLLTKTDG
jgi:hypothetical protein